MKIEEGLKINKGKLQVGWVGQVIQPVVCGQHVLCKVSENTLQNY